jgi:transcriptional regulator with XRE-family HTH domain
MEADTVTPILALRRLRVEAALSQRDLADRAGVTQTTIVKAEAGHEVRPSTVRRLAKALGVEPRELVNGERS